MKIDRRLDAVVFTPRRGCTAPISVFLVVLGVAIAVVGLGLDPSNSDITRIIIGAFAALPVFAGAGLLLSSQRVILNVARREVLTEQRVFGLPQHTTVLFDELARLVLEKRGEHRFVVVAGGPGGETVLAEAKTYREASAAAAVAAEALDLRVIDRVVDPERRRDAPAPLLLPGSPHPGPLPDGSSFDVAYAAGTFTVRTGSELVVMRSDHLRVDDDAFAAGEIAAFDLRENDVCIKRIGKNSLIIAANTPRSQRAWLIAAMRFYVGGGDADQRGDPATDLGDR